MTEIRLATKSDYPNLLELTKEFYIVSGIDRMMDLDPNSMVTTFDALLHEGILLVADNKILVGVLAAAIVPTFYNRNVLSAHELYWYVLPDTQGKGIGKRLLEAFMAICKERNVILMSVTNAANEYADQVGRMYRKYGFADIGRTYMRTV